VLNSLMTIVAIALIDKRGRKFLLTIGTGGVIVALLASAVLFHRFESKRFDVRQSVETAQIDNRVILPLSTLPAGHGAMSLTVLYSYGEGDKVVTVLDAGEDPVLRIVPVATTSVSAPLTIKRALYGPIPSQQTGWLITVCIALFIASFSIGPGVVVWLTLSELMPTRIRSAGMGIALLLNQAVSTLIAGIFLPVVGRYGYYAMFLFWALCTVIYFVTAAFFLPETKGKTLEEIERYFDVAR
jgi:MFS transporter, SP family, solute carrier family 2 (myo-inositol transporter), member 13